MSEFGGLWVNRVGPLAILAISENFKSNLPTYQLINITINFGAGMK